MRNIEKITVKWSDGKKSVIEFNDETTINLYRGLRETAIGGNYYSNEDTGKNVVIFLDMPESSRKLFHEKITKSIMKIINS